MAVSDVLAVPVLGTSVVHVRGMVRAGWVQGVGIPGEYPAAKDVPTSGGNPSEAGPGSPQGLEWVGIAAAPPVRPHPPFGPGPGPAGHSLVLLEQTPPQGQ